MDPLWLLFPTSSRLAGFVLVVAAIAAVVAVVRHKPSYIPLTFAASLALTSAIGFSLEASAIYPALGIFWIGLVEFAAAVAIFWLFARDQYRSVRLVRASSWLTLAALMSVIGLDLLQRDSVASPQHYDSAAQTYAMATAGLTAARWLVWLFSLMLVSSIAYWCHDHARRYRLTLPPDSLQMATYDIGRRRSGNPAAGHAAKAIRTTAERS